jgi:6-pyruvoyltetrahydropterin/6-carboxytetrahydropterin synthase
MSARAVPTQAIDFLSERRHEPLARTMTYELTQRFYFEAAHTLQRAGEIDGGSARDASRRIHGHTYLARVTVGGEPAPATGMVVDLALLRAEIERTRALLDHRLLDDVVGLGAPTLENLCAFVYREVARTGWRIVRVEVGREASGDACTLQLG